LTPWKNGIASHETTITAGSTHAMTRRPIVHDRYSVIYGKSLGSSGDGIYGTNTRRLTARAGFFFLLHFKFCFAICWLVSVYCYGGLGWQVGRFSITALPVWRWFGFLDFPCGDQKGKGGKEEERGRGKGTFKTFLSIPSYIFCHLSGFLGLSIPYPVFTFHCFCCLGSLYHTVT
jgi:hypothetical protein